MDDQAALENIRNGGRDGVEVLRQRYEERLRDYAAWYLSKKQVADAVQQVFDNLGRDIDQQDDVSTWLYKLTDSAIDDVALKNIREGNRINFLVFCLTNETKFSQEIWFLIYLNALVLKHEQEEGYTILHKHYVTTLVNYIKVQYRRSQDDAEDIVQKAFLNAFRNIMNFRGEGTLSAWLFTIVNRAAIDWLDEEGRHEHKDIDAQDEDTPGDEKISDPSAKIAQNDSEDYICLKQLIARLEKEGKTNLSECLQAYIWKSLDYPQDEIAPKIGRTYQATRQFMSTCIKKLRQYSPFQECQDIFLKMCFEDLERNTSDTELKRCLQVYLLKLQEPTDIRKIAKEIGKTVKDTKIELYDCGKRLMQEPSLQEKCREWFRQEMFQQCGDIFLPICLERELERGNFDTKLIGCLRAHILKSQGKSVKEIAKQIGKNTDETKIYLEECRKMLVQEPSIQKECGEWLSDPEWNEETGKK